MHVRAVFVFIRMCYNKIMLESNFNKEGQMENVSKEEILALSNSLDDYRVTSSQMKTNMVFSKLEAAFNKNPKVVQGILRISLEELKDRRLEIEEKRILDLLKEFKELLVVKGKNPGRERQVRWEINKALEKGIIKNGHLSEEIKKELAN